MTEMISYAQNGEDVVLHRAFADRERGFYVDVGACDSLVDSVTLHFYERGWRGINIEPDRELGALLAQSRPRDVTLCVAVGRERSRVNFYPTATRGHGTLHAELASSRSKGRECERVPQLPLSDVIDCYGPDDGRIDFLKIDVEGAEADVIASADWTRQRPLVLLIEARGLTGEATHADWEPSLLAAGYRFAMFDGLNRFYCRDEDADWLLPRLEAPANPLDRWVRVREKQLSDELAKTRVESAENLTAARAVITETELRAEALRADLEAARAAESEGRRLVAAIQLELEHTRGKVDAARERADALAVEAERARAQAATALRREETAELRLAELELEAVRASAELRRLQGIEHLLAATHASTSWKLSAPVRWFGSLAQSLRTLGRSQ